MLRPYSARCQIRIEVFLMLKIGAKAPAFRLQSDEGKQLALKDFAGRRVLLFFFPKANTSG